MTRDPSDGTVKEKPVVGIPTSGLRTDKLKADELARLERAREWLKDYHIKKSALALETGAENGHCPGLTDPSDAVAVNNSGSTNHRSDIATYRSSEIGEA